MTISDLFGVPFVPTRQKSLSKIFANLKVKKNDVFYDLGCGDGRLAFYIANKYKIKAVGIELNPLLSFYSKMKKKLTKNTQVEFYRQDIFKTSFKPASIIYLFLFPKIVDRLVPKFLKECKKGTIIVSHGFQAKALSKHEYLRLTDKPFPTYFYRL